MSMGSSLPTNVGFLLSFGTRILDFLPLGDCGIGADKSLSAVSSEGREPTKPPGCVVKHRSSGRWLVGEAAAACSERSAFDWFACQIARNGVDITTLLYKSQ